MYPMASTITTIATSSNVRDRPFACTSRRGAVASVCSASVRICANLSCAPRGRKRQDARLPAVLDERLVQLSPAPVRLDRRPHLAGLSHIPERRIRLLRVPPRNDQTTLPASLRPLLPLPTLGTDHLRGCRL